MVTIRYSDDVHMKVIKKTMTVKFSMHNYYNSFFLIFNFLIVLNFLGLIPIDERHILLQFTFHRKEDDTSFLIYSIHSFKNKSKKEKFY